MLDKLLPISLSIVSLSIVIALSVILLIKYNNFQSIIDKRVNTIVSGVNKANYDEYITNMEQSKELNSTNNMISSGIITTLSNQRYWQNNTMSMGKYGLTQNLNKNAVTLSDNTGKTQQGSFVANSIRTSNMNIQSGVTQYNSNNIKTEFNSIKENINNIGGDTDLYGRFRTYGPLIANNDSIFNGKIISNDNININADNKLFIGTTGENVGKNRTGLHSQGYSNFGIYNNGFTVLNIDSNNNINTNKILNILDSQNNKTSIGYANSILTGKNDFSIYSKGSNALSIDSNATVSVNSYMKIQKSNNNYMLLGNWSNMSGISSYGPHNLNLYNRNTLGLSIDSWGNTNINENLLINNKYALVSDYPMNGLNITDNTGSNLESIAANQLNSSTANIADTLYANKMIASSIAYGQVLPSNYPGTNNKFMGGIQTHDLYSGSYIAAGTDSNINSYINAAGELAGDHININNVNIKNNNTHMIQYQPSNNPLNSFGIGMWSNSTQLYADGTPGSKSAINIGMRKGMTNFNNIVQIKQSPSNNVIINGTLTLCDINGNNCRNL